MPLLRNLSCGEIVAQVVAAIREGAARGMPPVRNVVFMGMGEPLDNLHAVTAAAEILSAEGGLGFGPRHVTVSTVGTTAQAIRAAAELPAHLAWSLHAADDETRKRLIPTARGSVQTLRDGFLDAVRDTLFVEVVLIDGVNDSLPDARAIAGLFEGFRIRGREVRINLLPMNAIEAAQAEDLHPSPPEKVSAFQETLRQSGYFCMVRKSRGVEGSSACGQLVTRHSGI